VRALGIAVGVAAAIAIAVAVAVAVNWATDDPLFNARETRLCWTLLINHSKGNRDEQGRHCVTLVFRLAHRRAADAG
jgi:hypothetical protein